MRELVKVHPVASEQLRLWQRFFMRRTQAWFTFPHLFHQDCLNEPDRLDTCKQAKFHPIQRNWLRWINKPSQELMAPWVLEFVHDDSVEAAFFSPDGLRIVTTSLDSTARVWDAQTGEEVCRLRHYNWVKTAVFSPDGLRIVTASSDSTARVWDAQTGEEFCRLKHDDCVQTAVFSPDGLRIVTASADKTARVWDAQTGEEFCRLKHDDSVEAAFFSPDGLRIVTASLDSTARVWDAQTALLLVTTCSRVNSRTLNWFEKIETRVKFAQTSCPRCLGKGVVDEEDIERFGMQGQWQSGRCQRCAKVRVPPLAQMVFETNLTSDDSRDDGLIVAGLDSGQVCLLQYQQVDPSLLGS
jgi:hypothetical protein